MLTVKLFLVRLPVILSPFAVILRGAKNLLSPLRAGSAKHALWFESIGDQQIPSTSLRTSLRCAQHDSGKQCFNKLLEYWGSIRAL